GIADPLAFAQVASAYDIQHLDQVLGQIRVRRHVGAGAAGRLAAARRPGEGFGNGAQSLLGHVGTARHVGGREGLDRGAQPDGLRVSNPGVATDSSGLPPTSRKTSPSPNGIRPAGQMPTRLAAMNFADWSMVAGENILFEPSACSQ